MAKNKAEKPGQPSKPAPAKATPEAAKSKNPFALNSQYNQQTRKLLNKHYRAKHGVK